MADPAGGTTTFSLSAFGSLQDDFIRDTFGPAIRQDIRTLEGGGVPTDAAFAVPKFRRRGDDSKEKRLNFNKLARAVFGSDGTSGDVPTAETTNSQTHKLVQVLCRLRKAVESKRIDAKRRARELRQQIADLIADLIALETQARGVIEASESRVRKITLELRNVVESERRARANHCTDELEDFEHRARWILSSLERRAFAQWSSEEDTSRHDIEQAEKGLEDLVDKANGADLTVADNLHASLVHVLDDCPYASIGQTLLCMSASSTNPHRRPATVPDRQTAVGLKRAARSIVDELRALKRDIPVAVLGSRDSGQARVCVWELLTAFFKVASDTADPRGEAVGVSKLRSVVEDSKTILEAFGMCSSSGHTRFSHAVVLDFSCTTGVLRRVKLQGKLIPGTNVLTDIPAVRYLVSARSENELKPKGIDPVEAAHLSLDRDADKQAFNMLDAALDRTIAVQEKEQLYDVLLALCKMILYLVDTHPTVSDDNVATVVRHAASLLHPTDNGHALQEVLKHQDDDARRFALTVCAEAVAAAVFDHIVALLNVKLGSGGAVDDGKSTEDRSVTLFVVPGHSQSQGSGLAELYCNQFSDRLTATFVDQCIAAPDRAAKDEVEGYSSVLRQEAGATDAGTLRRWAQQAKRIVDELTDSVKWAGFTAADLTAGVRKAVADLKLPQEFSAGIDGDGSLEIKHGTCTAKYTLDSLISAAFASKIADHVTKAVATFSSDLRGANKKRSHRAEFVDHATRLAASCAIPGARFVLAVRMDPSDANEAKRQIVATRICDLVALCSKGYPVRMISPDFVTFSAVPEDHEAVILIRQHRVAEAANAVARECEMDQQQQQQPVGSRTADVFLSHANWRRLCAFRAQRLREMTVAAATRGDSMSPARGSLDGVGFRRLVADGTGDGAGDSLGVGFEVNSADEDSDTTVRKRKSKQRDNQLTKLKSGHLARSPALDWEHLLAHGCIFSGPRSALYNRDLMLRYANHLIEQCFGDSLRSWSEAVAGEYNTPIDRATTMWTRLSHDNLIRAETAHDVPRQCEVDVVVLLVVLAHFQTHVTSHLDRAVDWTQRHARKDHVSSRFKCPDATWHEMLEHVTEAIEWVKRQHTIDLLDIEVMDQQWWKNVRTALFEPVNAKEVARKRLFDVFEQVCEFMVLPHVWTYGPVPEPRELGLPADITCSTVHFLFTEDAAFNTQREREHRSVSTAGLLYDEIRQRMAAQRNAIGGDRSDELSRVGHALHMLLLELRMNEARVNEVVRANAALFAALRIGAAGADSEALEAVLASLRGVGLERSAIDSIASPGSCNAVDDAMKLRKVGDWTGNTLPELRDLLGSVVDFSQHHGARDPQHVGRRLRNPEWAKHFRDRRDVFIQKCVGEHGTLDAAVEHYARVVVGANAPVNQLVLALAITYDFDQREKANSDPEEEEGMMRHTTSSAYADFPIDAEETAGQNTVQRLTEFTDCVDAAIKGARNHNYGSDDPSVPLAEKRAAARYMVAFMSNVSVNLWKLVFSSLVLMLKRLEACADTALNKLLQPVPDASVVHVVKPDALCISTARCGAASFSDVGFRLDGSYTLKAADADTNVGVAAAGGGGMGNKRANRRTYSLTWEPDGNQRTLADAIRDVNARHLAAVAATRRDADRRKQPLKQPGANDHQKAADAPEEENHEVLLLVTLHERSEQVKVRCRVDNKARIEFIGVKLGGNQTELKCSRIIAYSTHRQRIPFERIALVMDGASVLPWADSTDPPEVRESAAMLAEAILENGNRKGIRPTPAGDAHFERGIEYLDSDDDADTDAADAQQARDSSGQRVTELPVNKTVGYRISVQLRRQLPHVDQAVVDFWQRGLKFADDLGRNLRRLLPERDDQVRCLMVAKTELPTVEELLTTLCIPLHEVRIDDQSFAAKLEFITDLARQPGYAIVHIVVDGHVTDRRIERLLASAIGTGLRFVVVASLSVIAFAREGVLHTLSASQALKATQMCAYSRDGAVGTITLRHDVVDSTLLAELEATVSSTDYRDGPLALAAEPWKRRVLALLERFRVVLVNLRGSNVAPSDVAKVASTSADTSWIEDLATAENQRSLIEARLRELRPGKRLLGAVNQPAMGAVLPSCVGVLVPTGLVEARHSLDNDLVAASTVAQREHLMEHPSSGLLALLGCANEEEFKRCMNTWKETGDARRAAIASVIAAPRRIPFACFAETVPVCELVDQRLRVHLYFHAIGAQPVPQLLDHVNNIHGSSLWDSFVSGRMTPGSPQRVEEHYSSTASYVTACVGGTRRPADILEAALRERIELDWNKLQKEWPGGGFEYSESFLLQALSMYHQPLKILTAIGTSLFFTLEGSAVTGPPPKFVGTPRAKSCGQKEVVPWAQEVLRRLLDPAAAAVYRYAAEHSSSAVAFLSALKWLLLAGGAGTGGDAATAMTGLDLENIDRAGIVMAVAGQDSTLDAADRQKVLQVVAAMQGTPQLFTKQVRLRDYFLGTPALGEGVVTALSDAELKQLRATFAPGRQQFGSAFASLFVDVKLSESSTLRSSWPAVSKIWRWYHAGDDKRAPLAADDGVRNLMQCLSDDALVHLIALCGGRRDRLEPLFDVIEKVRSPEETARVLVRTLELQTTEARLSCIVALCVCRADVTDGLPVEFLPDVRDMLKNNSASEQFKRFVAGERVARVPAEIDEKLLAAFARAFDDPPTKLSLSATVEFFAASLYTASRTALLQYASRLPAETPNRSAVCAALWVMQPLAPCPLSLSDTEIIVQLRDFMETGHDEAQRFRYLVEKEQASACDLALALTKRFHTLTLSNVRAYEAAVKPDQPIVPLTKTHVLSYQRNLKERQAGEQGGGVPVVVYAVASVERLLPPDEYNRLFQESKYETSAFDDDLDVSSGLSPTTVARNLSCLARSKAIEGDLEEETSEANTWYMHALAILWFTCSGVPPNNIPLLVSETDEREVGQDNADPDGAAQANPKEKKNVRELIKASIHRVMNPSEDCVVLNEDVYIPLPTYIDTHVLQTSPFLHLFANDTEDNVAYTYQTLAAGLAGLDEVHGDIVVGGKTIVWPTLQESFGLIDEKKLHIVFGQLTGARLATTWHRLHSADDATKDQQALMVLGALSGVLGVWNSTDRSDDSPAIEMLAEVTRTALGSQVLAGNALRSSRYELSAALVGAIGFTIGQRRLLGRVLDTVSAMKCRVSDDMMTELECFVMTKVLEKTFFDPEPWGKMLEKEQEEDKRNGVQPPAPGDAPETLDELYDTLKKALSATEPEKGPALPKEPMPRPRVESSGDGVASTSTAKAVSLFHISEGRKTEDNQNTLSLGGAAASGGASDGNTLFDEEDDRRKRHWVVDVSNLLAVEECAERESFFSRVRVLPGADCAVVDELSVFKVVPITDPAIKIRPVEQQFADHGLAWNWCTALPPPVTLVSTSQGFVMHRPSKGSKFLSFAGQWPPPPPPTTDPRPTVPVRIWHMVAFHDVLSLNYPDSVINAGRAICRAIALGVPDFVAKYGDELPEDNDIQTAWYLCQHTDEQAVRSAHDAFHVVFKGILAEAYNKRGVCREDSSISIPREAFNLALIGAKTNKENFAILSRCFADKPKEDLYLALRQVANEGSHDFLSEMLSVETYARRSNNTPNVAKLALVTSALGPSAASRLQRAMATFSSWNSAERQQQVDLQLRWSGHSQSANSLYPDASNPYAYDVYPERDKEKAKLDADGNWTGPPLKGGVQCRDALAVQFIVSNELLSSPFIFERRARPEKYHQAFGMEVGWMYDRRYIGAAEPTAALLPRHEHFKAERGWLVDVLAAPLPSIWKRWLLLHMYLNSARPAPEQQNTVAQCLATRHQEATTQAVLVNAIDPPLPMCSRKNRLYAVIAISASEFAQYEAPLSRARVRLHASENRAPEEQYREIVTAFNPQTTHVVVEGLEMIPDLMLKWCCEYTKRWPWRFIVLLDCDTSQNLPENRDRVQNFLPVSDERISRPRVRVEFGHTDGLDYPDLVKETFDGKHIVTERSTKRFEWTDEVTGMVDSGRKRLVLHLVSAPGAGKSYLMGELEKRAESSKTTAFRFFDCSDDRLCEEALGALLSDAIAGVEPGQKLVLVADEYHLLEAKKKYEFLTWVADPERLKSVKVVMIANRADEIDERSLKELSITANHTEADPVVEEVYGRISAAKVRFVAEKVLRLPGVNDPKRALAVSKVVCFYSSLRNLLSDDAITFRFLDSVPFREETDPEAAGLRRSMTKELCNKMIRLGSVAPRSFVRYFDSLWEQLKSDKLLPGQTNRIQDPTERKTKLQAHLRTFLNGSPLRLLTFVSMLPSITQYDPDKAMSQLAKERLAKAVADAAKTNAAAAAGGDDSDKSKEKEPAASELYRTESFDDLLTYKELMAKIPSSFRAHPILRLAIWVEYCVKESRVGEDSAGVDPLRDDEMNSVLTTLRRMTVVDQTDFPIVLDERCAEASLGAVESVYKKGDDLTDLDWIYDCVKRGQAVNWADIKDAWATTPVTNGAKLQAIMKEVAPSVVFDALTRRNVMQLLRKSNDIRSSVLSDYPVDRIAEESSEFMCPYFFALWSAVTSQTDIDAWGRAPLALIGKELNTERMQQLPACCDIDGLVGRILLFAQWVASYGALITAVPNKPEERTRCVFQVLVYISELIVGGTDTPGDRELSPRLLDIVAKLWSSPYCAPLADITEMPLDIAFEIAGRRNPPVAQWPRGMHLLNRAYAASKGGQALTTQEAEELATEYDVTSSARQPPKLIAALLQAEVPGWFSSEVSEKLIQTTAVIPQSCVVSERAKHIERNVLAAVINAKCQMQLSGAVGEQLIGAYSRYLRGSEPSLKRSGVVRRQRMDAGRMGDAAFDFYNQDAVFKKGSYKAAKKDAFGNAAGDFELCKDGAFKGFRVLMVDLYQNMCVHQVRPLLEKKGFILDVVPNLDQWADKLDPAVYHQAWLISNNGSVPAALQKKLLPKVRAFHCSGRGLFISADNDPFFTEANVILNDLFKFKLIGNTPGNKTLKPGKPLDKGCFGEHLLATGLESIYEGVTICYPDHLPEAFCVLGTSTDNHPVLFATQDTYADFKTASKKPYGRVVVDCGFTKLFAGYIDKAAGTGRYVTNVAAWLCMREFKRFRKPEGDGKPIDPAPWPPQQRS